MILSSLKTAFFDSTAGNHFVQICPNEAYQVETLTNYIKAGLLNNEAVIVIARAPLRASVIFKLNAQGFNMQNLRNKDQVKFFDAEFLLSGLLQNGTLDEEAFHMSVELPAQAAKLKYGKVRTFGEMVDILWKGGKYNLAVQLEKLCSDLCERRKLIHFCTYLLTTLDSNAYAQSLERICRCHTHLVPMNTSLNPSVCGVSLDIFWTAWNQVIASLGSFKSH